MGLGVDWIQAKCVGVGGEVKGTTDARRLTLIKAKAEETAQARSAQGKASGRGKPRLARFVAGH
jgi:hypothetical protein